MMVKSGLDFFFLKFQAPIQPFWADFFAQYDEEILHFFSFMFLVLQILRFPPVKLQYQKRQTGCFRFLRSSQQRRRNCGRRRDVGGHGRQRPRRPQRRPGQVRHALFSLSINLLPSHSNFLSGKICPFLQG